MVIIEKLVKKAQKGNDKAFLKLFKQFEADLYRTAYLYVKNENDALDVIQETAYKAYRNIKNVKQPQYIKSWLIKITISNAVDLIRKNSKIVHINPDQVESIGIENDDIPLSVSLEELLTSLDENDKRLVMLKYYFGYTFKEIAEIEEIPIGTVKSMIYRALQKLRTQVRRADLYEQ